MRVLFVLDTLGRTRHFRDVIQGLAERGHTVVLATGGAPPKERRGRYQHPRIEIVACPTRRSDRWSLLVDSLRRTRDAVRYLNPDFAQSIDLARRAAARAPRRWARALERHPSLRRRWALLERGLALVEHVTPCDPACGRFIESHAPDLVAVSPLVDFDSSQTDYVKSAHAAGIPVVFLPFSWDNLTSKGLIRVAPDRVLVWNEEQRREAVALHGVPVDRVVVTGAPRFDEFFGMQPSHPREQFCRAVGLDPSRPLLLYVCSSSPIAPREVPFVRQWVSELRRSTAAAWLRECGVVIRPHPASRKEWDGADFTDLGGTAIWSERSTLNADQGLFDSIFHAAAVVGLNTSAMIEAAIVGRPVYTIAVPEFAGGQCGTLHFQYLLESHGGIVSMSDRFDTHFQAIAAAPDQTAETIARARRFLGRFVRPRGLDLPAATVMIEEFEHAASLRKRPHPTPMWHYPLRWALAAASYGAFHRGARSS